jgi:hypothetical protein
MSVNSTPFIILAGAMAGRVYGEFTAKDAVMCKAAQRMAATASSQRGR